MSVDFVTVHQEVRRIGEGASDRYERLRNLRQLALDELHSLEKNPDEVHRRIGRVAREFDPSLRCAVTGKESTDKGYPLPASPAKATIIAADGSQINPDRHEEVQYALINVGVIQLEHGSSQAPLVESHTELFYDEKLFTETGVITDAKLALLRDLGERKQLVKTASLSLPPVVAICDGPVELWGAQDVDSSTDFQQNLEKYLTSLDDLATLGAIVCGYVDKPAANLVIRLLEVMSMDESELPGLRNKHPLRGIYDSDIFKDILNPGERSAVFEIQARSAALYRGKLGLRFFYLNVGQSGNDWIARIEVPAWVADDAQMLENLHAILVDQCNILGSKPYPYVLQRAHEAALVTWNEKNQVTQMIVQELISKGVPVGELSHKQYAKNL